MVELLAPLGPWLVLGSALCAIGASFVVCYMIWSAGWEGWESWNARTGLNENEALYERQERFRKKK